MTYTVCDGCGEKLKRFKNVFEYLVHLDDIVNGKTPGYADSAFNPVSGRFISKDLCNKCYNKVVIKAVQELKNIQNENKEEEGELDS